MLRRARRRRLRRRAHPRGRTSACCRSPADRAKLRQATSRSPPIHFADGPVIRKNHVATRVGSSRQLGPTTRFSQRLAAELPLPRQDEQADERALLRARTGQMARPYDGNTYSDTARQRYSEKERCLGGRQVGEGATPTQVCPAGLAIHTALHLALQADSRAALRRVLHAAGYASATLRLWQQTLIESR